MTDELLPCPFCGGDVVNMGVRPHFREGKGNGWTVLCADCGGSIGYIERPDGHFYAEYDTKPEAVAAWNARAERTCQCTTDDNAWCFACSECGKTFPRSDLHYAHNHGEINYCPNCGAKVVDA